jgi:dienelactone hydrolase
MTRHLALLACFFVASCAIISPQERGQRLDTLAQANLWKKIRIPTPKFVLSAYVAEQAASSDVLTIYIEGDGLAWLSRSQPSDNPTPAKPVALELALQHKPGVAAYLSRPCQNIAAQDWNNCRQSDWTNRRFSPEVIEASSLAIDNLKTRHGAKSLILIGYSGGGAVAALVAARRQDVIRLVTVAGNMDTETWTISQKATPLTGSLNPADAWEKLQEIPQMHFVGSKDPVIKEEVLASYLSRFPRENRPAMKIIADFDHVCCWSADWPWLLPAAIP